MAKGSDGNKGVVELAPVDMAFSDRGIGEGDLETTDGTEVPGGGAPLTIWSSLEPDMVRQSRWLIRRLRRPALGWGCVQLCSVV